MAVTFSDRITISIEPGKDDPAFGSVLAKLVAHLELYRAMGIHKQWIKGAMFNQFVKERYPGRGNSPTTLHNPVVSNSSIEVRAGERFHDRINVSIKPGRSSDRNNRMLTEFVEFLDLAKSMGTLQQWVKQACIAQFEQMQSGVVEAAQQHTPVDHSEGEGSKAFTSQTEYLSPVSLVEAEEVSPSVPSVQIDRAESVESELVSAEVIDEPSPLPAPKRKRGIAKLMG